MTNDDAYGDYPNAEVRVVEPVEYGRAAGKSPRELPAPPGLLLAAMLSRRVRVPLEGGMQWMSGYDALANVLGERSAAGDTRAAMLLADLNRYAALTEPKDHGLPGHVAPRTEAERALATAFVRRVAAGLRIDEPGKPGRGPLSIRAARRRERHHV